MSDPNWENPWPTAVPVRIEHLAEAIAGGASLAYRGNTVGNPEYLVEQWRERHGTTVDAYVLPGRDLNVGIRFGARPDQYLSPTVAQDRREAVRALLERATRPGYAIMRPRAYLALPAGSQAREDAFDEHLDAIRDDARHADDPDDSPYASSDVPHERDAWRGAVAEAKLGM